MSVRFRQSTTSSGPSPNDRPPGRSVSGSARLVKSAGCRGGLWRANSVSTLRPCAGRRRTTSGSRQGELGNCFLGGLGDGSRVGDRGDRGTPGRPSPVGDMNGQRFVPPPLDPAPARPSPGVRSRASPTIVGRCAAERGSSVLVRIPGGECASWPSRPPTTANRFRART